MFISKTSEDEQEQPTQLNQADTLYLKKMVRNTVLKEQE